MRIDIITLFPQVLSTLVHFGVTGRAVERGLLSINPWHLRDFADDNYRTVDDKSYGGGPGMVMLFEPLKKALDAIKADQERPGTVIYLSPQGERLTQAKVRYLAKKSPLTLICGRYEGIDERLLRQSVDLEISIGDYVLSGGELPAAVLIDAVSRLQEGALNNISSAEQDSFTESLLDYAHYTRPEIAGGEAVPDILRSGNHEAIATWRLKEQLGRTWLKRPDLLAHAQLNRQERVLLEAFRQEYLTRLASKKPLGESHE